MTNGERYQRMCPKHGRVLDGLDCPVGPHHVDEWKVVDTLKHRAVAAAQEDRGEVAILAETLRPRAPKVARRAVRERERPMEERREEAPKAKALGAMKKAAFTGPAGTLDVRWHGDAGRAYDEALKDAKAQEWQEHSAYTPIPSALGHCVPAKAPPRAATPRAGAAPGVGRCRKCSGTGHNARTCGRKGARKAAA